MALPVTWTHDSSYRESRDQLLRASDTIAADEFLSLPGFAPRVWLSQACLGLLVRAAEPCPERQRLRLRRQALRYLLRQVWASKHLGAYAGALNRSELALDAVPITLVVDAGEPVDCTIVAVLQESKLLLATIDEFPIGDEFWADRAILHALIFS